MKRCYFLLLLSPIAMANSEIITGLDQEMEFLKQNSFIESDLAHSELDNKIEDNIPENRQFEKNAEEFIDLDKKFFSDEVSIKKAAPKRRALDENELHEQSLPPKEWQESQKIDKPSFFKRILNNNQTKKIDGGAPSN